MHNSSTKVNINAKSGLARLLAIENLGVIHDPSAQTASFDVKGRVLRLPVLKDMSGYMYDAFIGHEISHALYTPADLHEVLKKKEYKDIPFPFINITEDARIEKLIQRRYPGLRRDFYYFYQELGDDTKGRDFFGLKQLEGQKGIDQLGLIDKINLHFKIGAFQKVNFSREEQPFVDMVDAEETWQDALDSAKAIFEYMKQNGQAIQSEIKVGILTDDPQDGEPQDGDEGETPDVIIDMREPSKQKQNDSNENSEDGNGESGSSQSQENGDGDDSSQGEGKDGKKEGKGKEGKSSSQDNKSQDGKSNQGDTQGNGNQKSDGTQSSNGGGSGASPAGVSQPKQDAAKPQGKGNAQNQKPVKIVVFQSGQTQTNFDKQSSALYESGKANGGITFGDAYNAQAIYKSSIVGAEVMEKSMDYALSGVSANVDQEYTQYIQEITPIINMMVNHFNMKKSAADYQKMQVSKTGEIDMADISMYKLKDDIFRRNEVVPESKNHGMVMYIDWSGSMTSNIFATLKQLIVLMEFCRKVHIPFEVYGFTDSSRYGSSGKGASTGEIFTQGGELFLMFSSSMKHAFFKKQCGSAYSLCRRGKGEAIHSMGGTPLVASAFLSEYIIRDFKERHKLEKTIFVLLSDGGAGDSVYNGSQQANKNVIMRDPMTSKCYEFQNDQTVFHSIFGYVKKKVGVTKMIGFFLTDSVNAGIGNLLAPNVSLNAQKHNSEFSTQKYTAYPKSVAFDKFFAVSINSFQLDKTDYLSKVDGNTSSNATQAALEKEFKKALNSLIFMRLFIEEIS